MFFSDSDILLSVSSDKAIAEITIKKYKEVGYFIAEASSLSQAQSVANQTGANIYAESSTDEKNYIEKTFNLNFWKTDQDNIFVKNDISQNATYALFEILLTSPPDISSKIFSIAENSIAGKAVGSLVATDADGDTITYSITGGNTDVDGDGKAAFKINASTGAITVNDAGDLNYEGTKAFELTVQASDGSLSSNAVATVNLSNVNEAPTGAVTISGTAIEGSKLTVASTLKDPDGAGKAKVQWLRDGSSISGATASSYTLTSSDVGESISARLSYTDGGGFAESRTSSAVVPSGLNPGVSIKGSDKVTGEDGNTAVFSVKLNKAPVDPVTIKFAVSDTTEAKLSTSSLTFTESPRVSWRPVGLSQTDVMA
jgi:hypothetical protein